MAMKTPAELAARLRKMVLAAQHHYSPTGEPLRSIVVTPEWLEDMADAANALDDAADAKLIKCDCTTEISPYGSRLTYCSSDQMRRAAEEGHAFVKLPSLDELTQKFGELPEVSGKVVSINKI
jgi:hypothetical protein